MNPGLAAESFVRVSGQHTSLYHFPHPHQNARGKFNNSHVLGPRTFVTQNGQRQLVFKFCFII